MDSWPTTKRVCFVPEDLPWVLCGTDTDLNARRIDSGPQREVGVITAESVVVQGWEGRSSRTRCRCSLRETEPSEG